MTISNLTPIRAMATVTNGALERRHARALERATALLNANPLSTPRTLADRVVIRYRQDLAWAGALSGASGVVPALGIPASAFASLAGLACLTTRTVDMILTVASLAGHTLDDLNERRNVVIGLMSGAGTWSAASPPVLNNVAAGLSGNIVGAIPHAGLAAVNRAAGRIVVTKSESRDGALRLDKVATLGIGMALGACGHFLVAATLGRAAIHYFCPSDLDGA